MRKEPLMCKPFDFDTCPDRRNTDSIKWKVPETLLPMFVADMDFRSPECVDRALKARISHGVYGYGSLTNGYVSALQNWEKELHGVSLQKEELSVVPGVITGLSWVLHTVCREGEGCIVPTPAYPPFFATPKSWNLSVRECPLLQKDSSWEMDFDAFEGLAKDPGVTSFILCNPHNPTGRAWSREDLIRMLTICRENHVFVLADEIHGDLALPGTAFTSVLSLPEELLTGAAVLNAPSKTFNLPGLQTSNLIIRDPDLRKRVTDELSTHHVSAPNILGLCAGEAAYREGRPWRDAMIEYVAGNFAFLKDFFAKKLPELPFAIPEATYLSWLDFRFTGLSGKELDRRFKEAGVFLGLGTNFGSAGEGYMRLTAGCPRSMLEEGASRIVKALSR